MLSRADFDHIPGKASSIATKASARCLGRPRYSQAEPSQYRAARDGSAGSGYQPGGAGNW